MICFNHVLQVTYKNPPNFAKFLRETWKISMEQTKFKREKFYTNHLKSFTKN